MDLTSQMPPAGFPLWLEITSAKLPKRSWIKISQIRTLSIERLSRRLGTISIDQLEQVIEGLNEIVGG